MILYIDLRFIHVPQKFTCTHTHTSRVIRLLLNFLLLGIYIIQSRFIIRVLGELVRILTLLVLYCSLGGRRVPFFRETQKNIVRIHAFLHTHTLRARLLSLVLACAHKQAHMLSEILLRCLIFGPK